MKQTKKDCNLERIEQIFEAGKNFAISPGSLLAQRYDADDLDDNIIVHCLHSMILICLALTADDAEKKLKSQMKKKNRSKGKIK